MKRYNLEETGQPFESDRQMEENPNGEWVRWDDVKKEIDEAYKKGLNCRTIDISMMELWCKQYRTSKECNCEEMSRSKSKWNLDLPGAWV